MNVSDIPTHLFVHGTVLCVVCVFFKVLLTVHHDLFVQ